MSRKVLIINLEFPPVGGPAVQRVVKFVRYLPETGWTPSVVCGDKSTWCDRYDYTLTNEVPDDVEVFRLSFRTLTDWSRIASNIVCNILLPLRLFWTMDKIQRNVTQTFLVLSEVFFYLHPEPLLSWIYLATKKAVRLYQKDNFDVVVTSGPPHITHMVGFMLKRFFKAKWVADFRDPWVDCETRGERRGISRRLDRLWERLVLESADRIISVSPSWSELFASKLSRAKDKKVRVVHHGYDPRDIP